MTTAELTARLKKQAKITSDEANEIGSDLLSSWVGDAVAEHNADYTGVENVPMRELVCVLILAWISVCMWRAGKYANEANESSGEYKQESATEYKKNTDLADRLRKRYDLIIGQLGIESTGTEVFQGDLVIRDDVTGGLVDVNAVHAPLAATLSVSGVTSDTAILKWALGYFSNFAQFYILYTHTPGIFQEWNLEGIDGLPKVRTDAVVLSRIYDFHQQAVKATNLIPNTDYYFMIVTQSGSKVCSYSNEVHVLTLP